MHNALARTRAIYSGHLVVRADYPTWRLQVVALAAQTHYALFVGLKVCTVSNLIALPAIAVTPRIYYLPILTSP